MSTGSKGADFSDRQARDLKKKKKEEEELAGQWGNSGG
jgi:hypothetical protein